MKTGEECGWVRRTHKSLRKVRLQVCSCWGVSTVPRCPLTSSIAPDSQLPSSQIQALRGLLLQLQHLREVLCYQQV